MIKQIKDFLRKSQNYETKVTIQIIGEKEKIGHVLSNGIDQYFGEELNYRFFDENNPDQIILNIQIYS